MIAACKSVICTALHVIQGTFNSLNEGVTYAETAIVASSFHEQIKIRKQYAKDLEEFNALKLADIDPLTNPLRRK